MMVEAEHYITSVGSHWLGTQPLHPGLPDPWCPAGREGPRGAKRWADRGPGSVTE